jgi:hypothetical protein
MKSRRVEARFASAFILSLYSARLLPFSLPLVLNTLNFKAAAGQRLERSQTVERFELLEPEYFLHPDYLKYARTAQHLQNNRLAFNNKGKGSVTVTSLL